MGNASNNQRKQASNQRKQVSHFLLALPSHLLCDLEAGILEAIRAGGGARQRSRVHEVKVNLQGMPIAGLW